MENSSKASLQGLEIAKQDEQGNSIRRINCLPGRITVLRSVRPMEAKLYEEVLSGQVAAKSFQITFRGVPFQPKEAIVVGAGADFLSTDGSVMEFLASIGANRSQQNKIISRCGLEGMERANCIDLSKAQQRALRLFSIPASPDKAAVLIDPFLNLPSAIVEAAASDLIEYVSTTQALIVVPRLTVRPEAWIENEYISRAQLERPRSATVGFGSDAISREELLAQMNLTPTGARPSKVLGVDLTAVDLGDRKRSAPHILRLFGIVVIGGATLFLGRAAYDNFWKTPSQPIQNSQISPIQPQEAAEVEERESSHTYPSEISEAVTAAFMKPDELLRNNLKAFAPAEVINQRGAPQRGVEPQEQPQAAIEAPNYEADQLSPDEMAERRKQIYERFMEAINKARATQGNGIE